LLWIHAMISDLSYGCEYMPFIMLLSVFIFHNMLHSNSVFLDRILSMLFKVLSFHIAVNLHSNSFLVYAQST
jgi:hypothetical protein